MIITTDILLIVSPNGNRTICDGLAKYLPAALDKYNINTPLRVQHFLGQSAHETAGFATLVEYASGSAYNGRADLGNTQPGDGPRYKGRGIFQLTGRANYKTFGTKLGADFINNPDLAADPRYAVLTACEYWNSRNLSSYADKDDLMTITRKINGGTNGLDDRKARTAAAKDAVANIFTTGFFK